MCTTWYLWRSIDLFFSFIWDLFIYFLFLLIMILDGTYIDFSWIVDKIDDLLSVGLLLDIEGVLQRLVVQLGELLAIQVFLLPHLLVDDTFHCFVFK